MSHRPDRRPPTGRPLAARLVPLMMLLLLASLLGACGGGDGEGEGDGKLQVAATTSIAADIVAQVGGDQVDVAQLVPDGASPHTYALSAREQQKLVDGALLVYFSPGLEQALPIDEASESFAFADHSDRAGTDPHVWLDPTLIASALPDLARALGQLDPAHASGYRRRAAAYGRELDRLDRRLQRLVDRLPPSRRKLVTSHDLMGYFAARYGFELVGAPFGSSPEAEASAGELADLIDRIVNDRVPAVFAQQGDDPEVLRQVADEAGVEIVDDLALETLGDGADSYEELMRSATETITDALGTD